MITGQDPLNLLGQRPMVDRYLSRERHALSAFSFVNIFLWKDHFHFRFEVIDGCLCVFAQSPLGTFLYLPPLGETVAPETIQRCFEVMARDNGPGGVSRVENVSDRQLEWFPGERFSRRRKNYEYCYYRRDLTLLKGNAFKSKRSQYNHFTRHYRHQYLPYGDAFRDDCLRLYKRWAGQRAQGCRDEVYLQMLAENEGVHRLALEHYRELGLIGRVVLVDGQAKAYTFGYPLGDETFCILLEIADVEVRGLPTFIFREFCADPALGPFRFINAMDDFAMDNLERTKLSFRPAVLLSSYVIAKNDERI